MLGRAGLDGPSRRHSLRWLEQLFTFYICRCVVAVSSFLWPAMLESATPYHLISFACGPACKTAGRFPTWPFWCIGDGLRCQRLVTRLGPADMRHAWSVTCNIRRPIFEKSVNPCRRHCPKSKQAGEHLWPNPPIRVGCHPFYKQTQIRPRS